VTDYYVRSAAAGTGTGADWTNAFTTITAALAVATNASKIYVADDHAVTAGAAITWTCPTSPGLQILGVNTHTSTPPTGLASTPSAVEQVGASSSAFSIAGYAYIEGLKIVSATNNSAAAVMNIGSGNLGHGLVLKNCILQLGNTGNAGSLISVGPAINSSVKDVSIELRDCNFKFNNAVQTIRLQSGLIEMRGCSIDAAGSTPTTLFTRLAAGIVKGLVQDCDLSGVSFTNLIDISTACSGDIIFRNSKVPSSVAVTTGSMTGPGSGVVHFQNCDSSGTNYRLADVSYAGFVLSETTIVRTGGATDGATPLSWKMVTNASSAYPATPLYSPQIAVWNDTTGSSVTATIEIVHDSVGAGTAGALQNDEIWLEIDYISSSGTPLGARVDNKKATVLTAAADQPSSSATWTTTGIATPLKQKLSVSFTAQQKGFVIGRVVLAKASKTVYAGPKFADLPGASTYQRQIPGGSYINEISGGGMIMTRLQTGM